MACFYSFVPLETPGWGFVGQESSAWTGTRYEAASLPALVLDSVLVLVFLAGAVFPGEESLLSLGDELAESGGEGGESDVSAVAELRPRLSVT